MLFQMKDISGGGLRPDDGREKEGLSEERQEPPHGQDRPQ